MMMLSYSKLAFIAIIVGLFTLWTPASIASVTRYTSFPMGPNISPSEKPSPQHHYRMQQNVGMDTGNVLTTDFGDPRTKQLRSSRFSNEMHETFWAMECSQLFHPDVPDFKPTREQIQGQALLTYLMQSNPNTQLSQQALGNMTNRGYIEGDSFNEYLSSDQNLHHYQTVNFSTVSWISVDEFRKLFQSDEIPWQHIAELRIHPTEHGQNPEQVLKNLNSKSEILLRRSSMRMLSSFNMGPYPELGLPLPWESTPGIQPRAYNEEPLSFELSRAAQLDGLNKEANELVSLAAIAALDRLMTIKTAPKGDPPPMEMATFWLHSLSPVNTRLYKRVLGMAVHQELKEPEYHAIMKIDLRSFINKIKAWEIHPEINELVQHLAADSEPEADNLYYALQYRKAYRETLRANIGLPEAFQDSDQDTLALRTNPQLAVDIFKARFQHWNEKEQNDLVRHMKDIELVDFSQRERGWGRDSFPWIGFDYFDKKLKVAAVISGFHKHAGNSDPNFARTLLS